MDFPVGFCRPSHGEARELHIEAFCPEAQGRGLGHWENHGRLEASWKIQWFFGGSERFGAMGLFIFPMKWGGGSELPRVSQPLKLVIWCHLVGALEHDWITTFHLLGIIIPTDELHHFSEGFNPPTSHRIWNQHYINSMSLKQQQWGYFNDENGELDKHEWWFTSKLWIEGKSCQNNTCNTNRIWFWMILVLVDVISKNWIFVVMNTSMIPRCLDRCRLRRWKAQLGVKTTQEQGFLEEVEYQIVMVESWLKPKSWCFWGNAWMILVLAACRLRHAVYKRRCVRNICSYDQKEKTSCSRRLPSCKQT